MKYIYYLLLLIPIYSFGQDAAVIKTNHIRTAVSYTKEPFFLLDSSVYNKDGLLIFYRTYNQFKAHSYEDQRHIYNHAGKRTRTINYDMDGNPWLTDSLVYDMTYKLIYEKTYRNPDGKVVREKTITYKGDSIFVNNEPFKEIPDLKPDRKEIPHFDKKGLITYIDYPGKQVWYRYTTY